MSKLDELKNAIEETGFTKGNKTTQEVLDELDIETYTDHEMEQMYRELLDEGGDIKVGLITFDQSDVLRTMDPIAYDVGFADYVSVDHEEIFIEGSREPLYVNREDSDRIEDYEPEESSE